MKKILFFALLLLNSACFSADSNYLATDKIQVLFYDGGNGELDDQQKVIGYPERVRLSVRMNIKQITRVEVSDVSSPDNDPRNTPPLDVYRKSWSDYVCHDHILKSPSTLASFTLNPKANIKKIEFHIRLPCAAYRHEFYIQVKVTSLGGNYVMKKKLPMLIDRRGSEG